MIEKLVIEATNNTPGVNFDPESGELEMHGIITQEDDTEFFKQIFDWLDSYRPDKTKQIVLKLSLFYYNTVASKRLLMMLKKLDALFQQGYNVRIIWEYEEGDEDSIQEYLGYKSFLKVPIVKQPMK